MKRLIFLIPLFLSLLVNGQNNALGFRSGRNYANICDNKFYYDTKSVTSSSFGITFNHYFRSNLFTEFDVQIDGRGFTNYLKYPDVNGNMIELRTSDFNFTYLMFPMKFGYSTTNRIYAFADIGLCPAFVTSATVKTNKLYDIGVSSFDLGCIGEVGLGYKFGNGLIIYSCFSYLQSLSSTKRITNGYNWGDESSFKHCETNLSFGLKFIFPE